VFQDGSNGAPTGRCHGRTRASARLGAYTEPSIEPTTPPQGTQGTQTGLSRQPNPQRPTPQVERWTGMSPFHIRLRRIAGPHSLPSRQFQALFDSLFKVLFIFPSRYLFAIGPSPVFSLGRDLPPDWGCILKQPDSPTTSRGATGSRHDGALTLSGSPFQGTCTRSVAEDASTDYNSEGATYRFSSWAVPGSLAVTKGILVSFFSSAY